MGRKKKRSVIRSLLSSWATILVVVCIIVSAASSVFDQDSSGSSSKKHECISDTMTAEVASDGSLHVVDSRTYEFTGSYTLTAAVLDPPVGGAAVVNGVSVTSEEGTVTELEEVPFETSWRYSGGPSSGHYAIDTAQNTVYAFSASTNVTKTFTFDYTYTNAIEQYSDVDILYWQFIGKDWDVDTQNVTTTLTLPVPEGQSVEGGQNVYAFGHGSLSGDVAFNEDNSISFTIPRVQSGTFAEMRVAFPTSWTPDIAPTQAIAADGLQDMLDEEKRWEDEAALERLKSALLFIVPVLISVACLIIAIVLFLRHGKEYKPQTPLDYWRDVPAKDIHPAVIGRLWRWDQEDANDIAATLMHLSNLGVVHIEKRDELVDRKILPDKLKTMYHLILKPEKRSELATDAIDNAALALVFDKVGARKTDVTLDNIRAYASNHSESYVNAVKRWNKAIDKQVEAHNFFEKTGDSIKTAFRIAAVLLCIATFYLGVLISNFAPFLGVLPGAIFLLVFAHFMPRRSREAVEIHERCEALKRWLRDFTALDQAIPTDAKVWGELLVYAYIFGIAEQVVDDLNRVMPDIWDDDGFTGSMLWYYNPHGPLHSSASSGDFFGRAFENTYTSASNAVAAANSSGGGGGSFGGAGGFSGGGGGGFGGGGGGFSR